MGIVEVKTSEGVIRWGPCGLLEGSAEALGQLRCPLPGRFGMMPGQVPYEQALTRKDSFLHLVARVWPEYQVLRDTVPDEEWSPGVVY